MNSVKSFPPLTSAKPRVLILGTAPSVKSLEKKQFYGHPKNALWPILFDIFKTPFTTDYKLRKKLVKQNNIALYDTVKLCQRRGSLDSNIKDMRPNDINAFLTAHPTVKFVFFNGRSAQKFYEKHWQKLPGVTYFSLPSTSPAYAFKTYAQKLKLWREAFNKATI